ncbi:MAG: hypothetical protein J1D87_11730, partial [Lachnospiraceae bacterium]|nr:hypothetical protein [Lachnospiraceae bacterium]
MKLYSQHCVAIKVYLRRMFAVLLVLLIAFDYDFIVYAREPVSFSHTYSESYYAFNSQYGSAS